MISFANLSVADHYRSAQGRVHFINAPTRSGGAAAALGTQPRTARPRDRAVRFPDLRRLGYSERRKFRRFCCCGALSPLKLSMTAFASDGPNVAFPALLWAWIAAIRSVVRPSWRKKRRCPKPHKGAVRN